MIKEITIQISVKYTNVGNKTIQRFTILGGKRNWRYLLDSRFYTRKIFNEEIWKRSLSTKSNNYMFESKVENENYVEVISVAYEGVLQNDFLTDYYFTIHDFVPTAFGCEYCYQNNDKRNIEETVWCNFFGKQVKRRKSSCKYFKQRRLFKT